MNFGPRDSLSVMEVVHLFEIAFQKKVIPELLKSSTPESEWLELDSELAHSYLGWQASISQIDAVRQTVRWYSDFASGQDARELMAEELGRFKIGKW